jgi:hypothetical protein
MRSTHVCCQNAGYLICASENEAEKEKQNHNFILTEKSFCIHQFGHGLSHTNLQYKYDVYMFNDKKEISLAVETFMELLRMHSLIF